MSDYSSFHISDYFSFRVFFVGIGFSNLITGIYNLTEPIKAADPQQRKYEKGRDLCRLFIGVGTVVIVVIEFIFHPFPEWYQVALAYGLLYPVPLLLIFYLRKKYGIRWERKKWSIWRKWKK